MLYEKLIGERKEQDREVLIIKNQKFSYRQLHAMVRNCSEMVIERGGDKEKCAVIFITSHIFSIIAILTCIYLGIPFILLDEKAHTNKVQYIFNLCKVKLVFGVGDNVKRYPNIHITTKTTQHILINRKRNRVDETKLGYILFTSGSTGAPKGVIANQREILFCLDRIQRRIQNTEKDTILSTLPLVFDYGLYQIFLALISGAKLIWEPDCLIQQVPALLVKNDITALPVIPTMFHLLMRTKLLDHVALPNLRYVCATGERWDISSIEKFHTYFPQVEILPMYGLTECKRVAIMPYGRYDKVLQGSCGIPLDDVEVVLNNKDEKTGIGELIVIGENVMEGYYGGVQDNSVVFGEFQGRKALYTGDLFYIDADGFLYFKGRINDIIKRRGIRISKGEIEKYFLAEKKVLEVCTVGIEDMVEGEKIILAIYAKEKTVEKSCQSIIAKMPELLKPEKIRYFSVPLPRNENGKLNHNEIRRQIEQENGT